MNFNIVGTGAQTLQSIGNPQFTQPHNNGTTDIIDGTGLGYYTGLLTEYNPGALFGGHLRVGLDDRRVGFNDWDVNGTGQTRFSARMTYVSVEPSLRVNLGSPDFHLLAGPLLSFKVATKYDYIPGRDETAPAIVDQPIEGTNSFTYGVSGGLGYDININSKSTGTTRWYLTPFVEASYMMDQRDNTLQANADRNDTWVTTSVRGGFQLKFGSAPAAPLAVVEVAEDLPIVDLSLRAPSAITDERRVTEMFPLRNYIFFDQGSTGIPAKYTRLSSTEAMNFDERNLLDLVVTGTSASSATRSQRQMGVYYHALNVFGDRMRDNPTASVTLVGSAPSQAEGLAMANTVRDYLVNTFGIEANRISTRGQVRPPHASGDRDTPKEDLALVAEENVRVEVLSENMNILKPVQINSVLAEPIDNDLALSVRTSAPVDNWTVTVSGEGFSQTYGPFRGTAQRIDAKPILGTRASGNYKATVTAVTTGGRTVTKTTDFTLVRRELPPVTGQRYSTLFEFDDSRTVQTYEQFLRNDVAPNIPSGATIVVHGHTDQVGLEDYNLELSSKRAAETRRVLEDELRKLGKSATFDSYGFGETETRAPFTNGSPEGRYYNRTVMIEVIPNS